MIKNIYKKVLLCAVCTIACNTNIAAMNRVTKIMGHIVEPGSGEEYSIAHARALRTMNTVGALKESDEKKPRFSSCHIQALELLIQNVFAQDGAQCENDVIEYFKNRMHDDDFRKNVYMHVGTILNNYQEGPISSKFITFLIVYAPEAQDMFAQITCCASDRFIALVACIQGARTMMRFDKPLTRYDVSNSLRSFIDITNKCSELLTKASKKSSL